MTNNKRFERKVRIEGNLVFETAFHIGSGKEGDLATNMGIMKERDGRPILPGSTLKGNFRSMAERFADYFNISNCYLDSSLSDLPEDKCITGVNDKDLKNSLNKAFKALVSEATKLTWIDDHVCDICRLFGSPVNASRIFFTDGQVLDWGQSVQIRDGVCIDRDTETARHAAKYDFEVAPQGAVFKTEIDILDPEDKELALTAAVLAEWENGFRLGGFTSRGLGRVRFIRTGVKQVEYSDRSQLKEFLLNHRMSEAPDLLADALSNALNP